MILMQHVVSCVQRSGKKRRGETMEACFLTDKGKVRPHNEDNGGIFYKEQSVLAVVADGMGGHKAGDVASSMTVKELEKLWGESEDLNTAEQAEKWLRDAVKQINDKLFVHAKENEECQGMGTTLVVSICTDEMIIVGHIGDSRCYIKNKSGFFQVTNDHSLVNELVRSGEITKEDAEHHPRKNVLMRALGTEAEVNVDIDIREWDQDDQLLLCSDGLTNMVSDQDINALLSNESSVKDNASTLLNMANDSGGEDNISIVIIKHRRTQVGNE